MESIKARLALRADSTAKWLENEFQVLLRGEVGVEFQDDGVVRLKIGDGIKTWSELDYFGDELRINGLQQALSDLGIRVQSVASHAIMEVQLAGEVLEASNNTINIPLATPEQAGLVRSSNANNKVSIANDGTMEIGQITADRLVQGEEALILYGGGATL